MSKIFGGYIYSNFGLKKSLIMAYLISLVGGACIFLIQSKFVDILPFFAPLRLNFSDLMALLTMVTSFGVGAAMFAVYNACFSDDNIFPSSKRATAIGICNVVARGLTVLAP